MFDKSCSFVPSFQAHEERNYHIFYCMLAGVTAEERAALSLGKAKEYTFLTKVLQYSCYFPFCKINNARYEIDWHFLRPLQGSCISCEGRNDAKDYLSIRSAMDLFFSEADCQDILKLLAAILHLGNISFEGECR